MLHLHPLLAQRPINALLLRCGDRRGDESIGGCNDDNLVAAVLMFF